MGTKYEIVLTHLAPPILGLLSPDKGAIIIPASDVLS
jgi:hypothetical protein